MEGTPIFYCPPFVKPLAEHEEVGPRRDAPRRPFSRRAFDTSRKAARMCTGHRWPVRGLVLRAADSHCCLIGGRRDGGVVAEPEARGRRRMTWLVRVRRGTAGEYCCSAASGWRPTRARSANFPGSRRDPHFLLPSGARLILVGQLGQTPTWRSGHHRGDRPSIQVLRRQRRNGRQWSGVRFQERVRDARGSGTVHPWSH